MAERREAPGDEPRSEKHKIGPSIFRSALKNRVNKKTGIFIFIGVMAVLIILLSSQLDYTKPSPRDLDLTGGGMGRGSEDELSSWIMGLQNAAKDTPAPPPPPPAVSADIPATNVVINMPPRAPRPRRRPAPQYQSYTPFAQAAEQMRVLKARALMGIPVVEGFNRSGGDGEGAQGRNVHSADPDASVRAASATDASGGGVPQASMTSSQQKHNFLYNPQEAQSLTKYGYSENLPFPQQFRYELKAGTMIPTILMNGIDSGIPGMVRAQVAENVWDSTYGTHVLIPKGTTVLGVYNTDVRFGDRRLMIVWNRLVFPNGMTLNIGGTAGTDQSGYSGVTGRVNEHWDKMFLSALVSSLFIAGADTLVGDDSSGGVAQSNERRSPRDAMAEALAANILEMNAKIVDRAINIAPTIRIRPGKRMGMFVNEDIVFPLPYPMDY